MLVKLIIYVKFCKRNIKLCIRDNLVGIMLSCLNFLFILNLLLFVIKHLNIKTLVLFYLVINFETHIVGGKQRGNKDNSIILEDKIYNLQKSNMFEEE